MQLLDSGHIRYSPSDLVTFLECPHASWLDTRNLTEKLDRKRPGPVERLLWKKGLEHEAKYLDHLKSTGADVREIPRGTTLEKQAESTAQAIAEGVEVIYQAAFLEEPWCGYSDFLIKCDAPSSLGRFSYEVLDTKLARMARPKHIIQLCAYSEMLAGIQGVLPSSMQLFTGNNERQVFKVSDFFAYYLRTRQRFEACMRAQPADPYPEPCAHCRFCPWEPHCTSRWESDDHLSLVAGIRRTQLNKLQKAGIHTVAQLAKTPVDLEVADLNQEVFLRLRQQAALQAVKNSTGRDACEVIPFASRKGLARMPEPDDGDLFFDMEGNPLHPNGLEYLFGLHRMSGGEAVFEQFWAHDHEEEKEAFKRFMGFLEDHLAGHPHAYVYHYGHYEVSALKRLSGRYAVCEKQLDSLLREQKFVDLYLVVRESLRSSEPGYSIKNLEVFYSGKRADPVATAVDSILVYNEWCESGEASLLQDIADYNQADCTSTRMLRDWLLTLRPDGTPWFMLQAEPVLDAARQLKASGASHENVRGILEKQPLESPAINERLTHLLGFHQRETKSQWWDRFERQNKLEDELVEDAECLGGLRQIGHPQAHGLTVIHTFEFPPQECKLRTGSPVVNVATMQPAGRVLELDENHRIVRIGRRSNMEPLPARFTAGPPGPVNSQGIQSAICSYVEKVARNPGKTFAATELLGRKLPRIHGRTAGTPIVTSRDMKAETFQAIAGLQNSYLFIQGPPGSGKTHIAGHVIVELVRQGKKIGISSNSHKAIHNLLSRVEKTAAGKNVGFHAVKKATRGNEETFFDSERVSNETRVEDIHLDMDIFAGTAWLFSHARMRSTLDYLFIDEAGQVSTANVVAMASSARNIVLVGDQMQLGQPVKGVHPGEAGLSVLEFLLGEEATIAPEQGIFLDRTYRLGPGICRFVSDAFYDGKLLPHENTSRRILDLRGSNLPNEGLVLASANHEGCSQKSIEEGELVRALYSELLGQSFKDLDGSARPISREDILVVTPYNVQANCLRSLLPEGARVGTVDKFQGQEAPIVLISMVTSSAEDLPRNVEFLYSKNRLNVAISRAQCLAVIIANSGLLEISCRTVEQMKLANTFCLLEEYATPLE